jgi:hypothetical protein
LLPAAPAWRLRSAGHVRVEPVKPLAAAYPH